MKAWRIVLAVLGIGVVAYGTSLLLTKVPLSSLVLLALWLVGALVIHDGLLSPAVVGVGWALKTYLPDRARTYVQFGLIAAAMITVIALPMIFLAFREPPSKALLVQNYGVNLTVLLAALAAATLVAYAVRVARGQPGAEEPSPTASG